MTRSAKKLNRSTVLEAVELGDITGRTLSKCAVNVIAYLELHSSCKRKAEELLAALMRDNEIALRDAVVHRITGSERAALRRERSAEAKRVQAIRQRTAQKRSGGVKRLPAEGIHLRVDPEDFERLARWAQLV